MERERSVRIAHVLFLDIVGYSRGTTEAQARTLDQLNAAVNASPAFAEARQAQAVLPLPSGDGMALLFFADVIAPARCALQIARALPALPLRMGIHSGLVQRQLDVSGNENYVGEGINTAQRVMDFGESGYILMSSQYATWLLQFDEWASCIHNLGAGQAKHGMLLQIFTLSSQGFGRCATPKRLSTKSPGADAHTVPAARRQRVALLYKSQLQPDETILQLLEKRLTEDGHDVYVDHQRKINPEWARSIEENIRMSDAVIAIVSPRALQSEMLAYEIETAHDQYQKSGRPIILPVSIGVDEEVNGPISAIIAPLNRFMWRSPEDDSRLIAEIVSAIREPLKPRAEEIKLEPVGGAMLPDSPFYIERCSDREFLEALENRESIILLRGARQVGKTSMLARGVQRARERGWRCGLSDFQKLNTSEMASEETFYRLLAATLSRQLQFPYDFPSEWTDLFGANMNMENYLRALLDAADRPLVWFMDEVDKLFSAPFASDFFGLVRSWHNSRSTEPGGCWDKLTVVIAYATEAHLFIQDLNQSPFNVGRRLELEDFNIQQMVDLNGRYGGPLRTYAETEALHALIAGQPYLARRALDALATGKEDLNSLLEQADWDAGLFGDHLKRMLASVSQLPAVLDYTKAVLEGKARPNQDAYYRLHAGGVIQQDRSGKIMFRCELYHQYLQKHLS